MFSWNETLSSIKDYITGIDIDLHRPHAAAEMEFVVAPEADPSAIRMVYRVVESMRVDEERQPRPHDGGT